MITHEQEIEIKNKLIEEKNNRIVKLEMEVERLRSELEHIANAKGHSFKHYHEMATWMKERARHALGQKPGELTIKK